MILSGKLGVNLLQNYEGQAGRINIVSLHVILKYRLRNECITDTDTHTSTTEIAVALAH